MSHNLKIAIRENIKSLVKSGLQLNFCPLTCVKRKVALGGGMEEKEQSWKSSLPFWKSQGLILGAGVIRDWWKASASRAVLRELSVLWMKSHWPYFHPFVPRKNSASKQPPLLSDSFGFANVEFISCLCMFLWLAQVVDYILLSLSLPLPHSPYGDTPTNQCH